MKYALVIGGAECLWDDLTTLPEPAFVVGCNEAARDYPGKLDWWATLHPEKLPDWMAGRKAQDYRTASFKDPNKGPKIDLTLFNWGGSSGLFAFQVARHFGWERVIFAGVPLDERPHYHGAGNAGKWPDCRHYRKHWQNNMHLIAPYARSCSGWTRDMLGGPEEWINTTT